MTSCPLPPQPEMFDVPHTMLGDFARQRDLITSLNLEKCNVTYIVIGLDEFGLKRLHEGHVGHRSESWPADIRARMETEIERWIKEANGSKTIRGFTQGVHGGTCTMGIHWRPKG